MKNQKKLILASNSPRRKELLSNLGIKFDIVPSFFDESQVPVLSPEEYVEIESYEKTLFVAKKFPETFVLGADTIVAVEDNILGKPKDKDNAFFMLKSLSGRSHFVFTAYSIINIKERIEKTKIVATEVFFKQLSKDEIYWYVKTGEPFGKAGAYAIQGIGSFLAKKIIGSYTNVVGLPMCEVVSDLKKFDIIKI